MKTKNINRPRGIPTRKPIPSQRLIRLDKASGLPGTTERGGDSRYANRSWLHDTEELA